MNEQPNLIYLHQISGGDMVIENKMKDIIKRELPLEIKEYRENLNNRNYIKTAENVHKLKHKISIFGLYESYQIALDYENSLNDNNPDLQYRFDEILNKLVNFVALI